MANQFLNNSDIESIYFNLKNIIALKLFELNKDNITSYLFVFMNEIQDGTWKIETITLELLQQVNDFELLNLLYDKNVVYKIKSEENIFLISLNNISLNKTSK